MTNTEISPNPCDRSVAPVPPGRPVAVVGPTASGKSAVALEIVRRAAANGRTVELVSVDSMQVYRGMDIGTAKATVAERAEVPHHLLDLAEPWEEFSLAEFQRACRTVLADIERRGATAILVGGTGLYLQAIVDDLTLPGQFPDVRSDLDGDADTAALFERLRALDPIAAARMEPTNRRRVVRALEVTLGSGRLFSSFGPGIDAYPPTRFRLVGIEIDRPSLDRRIDERYDAQMGAGLLDEVRRLDAHPTGLSRTAGQALGYKELLGHLHGDCTLEEALDLARRRTRTFARRQQRWFRRDPRIEWHDPTAAVAHILEGFNRCS